MLLAQTGKDAGEKTLSTIIQSEIDNLQTRLEKAVPRKTKFKILLAEQKKLKALSDAKRPASTMELADAFRQYMFLDEAKKLYRSVLEEPKADSRSTTKANQYLGEIAFVKDNDVAAAIDFMKKAIALAPDDSIQQANLLVKLGSYQFISEDTAGMLSSFQAFNALPDKIKQELPEEYVKANLYSARELKNRNPAEASKYFETAASVATEYPELFKSDFILSIYMENETALSRWNDPKRIKHLQKLFEDKRFKGEQRLNEIGLHVLFALFLKRKSDWKGFSEFYETIHDALTEFDKAHPNDVDTAQYSVQAITCYVYACEEAEKDFNRIGIKTEFKNWMEDAKQLKVYVPKGASREEVNIIASAIQMGAKSLMNDQSGEKKKRDE